MSIGEGQGKNWIALVGIMLLYIMAFILVLAYSNKDYKPSTKTVTYVSKLYECKRPIYMSKGKEIVTYCKDFDVIEDENFGELN